MDTETTKPKTGNRVTIYVDGQAYEVAENDNLLHACLSVGLDLPYFCWHPALHSVGACRQCAVKMFRNEQDAKGMIVMACMTPVKAGMCVSIEDPEAKSFRRSIIELLMLNHPHDCPVCDEGGECHLQDMTVMTGHNYRNHRFPKRTHRNQDLGPFVNHEMNRCIQCYRCVRFYRGYAGGRDLNVFASRDRVYFGRQQDGALESEFSGNLVEVCPTGVFTDKTLRRHYTRKWDLQMAPSICAHCGLGCNTTAGERYGTLRRIVNRYNGEVNGYFLCDRGRFGYEFVNSAQRVRGPRVRKTDGGTQEPAGAEEAVGFIAELLKSGKTAIGIGSPRASLESNFALRALVGPDRFFQGVAETERRLTAKALDILRTGPARAASILDAEQADAVLVLGEDLTNSAPRLALALRQAARRKPMEIIAKRGVLPWQDDAVRDVVQRETGPLFIASPTAGKLDDAALATYRAAPDDVARLGFAVAHALSPDCPAVPGLAEEARALAGQIAQALREADRPLVVSGPSCASEAVVEAAANVAWALRAAGRPAQLCYTAPESNSIGLALLGGRSLEDAGKAVESGAADVVVILENDLYRRADAAWVDALLAKAKAVVVLDHLDNSTAAKASVVLPAAPLFEADGIAVNNEGRAQRFVQVYTPAGDIQESWRWLRDVMIAVGRGSSGEWRNEDDVVAAAATAIPALASIVKAAPPADFRVVGQRIPRQPARYSGRTAMRAQIAVSEPKPPEDPDSPMSFSMEGAQGRAPSPLIPFFWVPGWNSIQALNKFQDEVAGPLHGGDPGARLIEPDPAAKADFFKTVPGAFARREGQWLVLPMVHIFGSEELSVLAPGIQEMSVGPCVALNPDDAAALGIASGAEVDVALPGSALRAPAVLRPDLPRGIAGVPAGLPALKAPSLPQWAKLLSRDRKGAESQ